MSTDVLRDYYQQRGLSEQQTNDAIAIVKELDEYLKTKGLSVNQAVVDEVKGFVNLLIETQRNSRGNLLALSRYFYITKQDDLYVYFASFFNTDGVVENIKMSIQESEGQPVADEIFADIEFPPLGTPPQMMPEFTNKVMTSIKSKLTPEVYRPLMAGNNHGIPKERMLKEKECYEQADSLADYLKGRHNRRVAELQQHCDENKLWFEQQITQEVVDFVESNQEILSAVRQNDELYVTKIPYDPVNYLHANNKEDKLYYACHCPFVREAIRDKTVIEPDWCYCSAGFAKYPFEVMFDTPLEVELLTSPLLGDELCRFKIKLPKHVK